MSQFETNLRQLNLRIIYIEFKTNVILTNDKRESVKMTRTFLLSFKCEEF